MQGVKAVRARGLIEERGTEVPYTASIRSCPDVAQGSPLKLEERYLCGGTGGQMSCRGYLRSFE